MSRYTVYVVPEEFQRIKELPGKVRQHVKKAIRDLAIDPRPADSKRLDLIEATRNLPDDEQIDCELRRLRIESWRIVYSVDEADQFVDVLAVRKRPPYDYGDLGELLGVE
jgi:mRNA interferase RelE/StbE